VTGGEYLVEKGSSRIELITNNMKLSTALIQKKIYK
jgi:hypothetical protein